MLLESEYLVAYTNFLVVVHDVMRIKQIIAFYSKKFLKFVK